MDLSEALGPRLADLQAELAQAQLRISHLARSEQLCRSGLIELNGCGQVVALSAGMLSLLGVPAGADLAGVGLTLDLLPWIPPRERLLVARFWRGATLDEPFEFEHSVLGADGQSLRVLHRGLLQASPIEGQPPCGIITLQDITERRDAERRMMQLANFDEVTGLANRANLLHQIDAAVHSSAWRGLGFCLMSIEVPRVAELALTMGFAAGDALASTLAARLRAQCGDDALVATLGSGEFALMLRHAGTSEVAQQQAGHIKAALQAPVNMNGMDILAPCSIGLAMFPGHGEESHALLGAAQTARREAAISGSVTVFSASSNARALRELQLEAALRLALQRNEFSLVYQPQVCLATGNIVGAEALLRWHTAEWGAVPANEFVPVAERSGLIVAIGDWVMHQACAQIVQWMQAGLSPVRLGVNISPVQFQVGDVALSIRQALADTGAQAHWLALELTEAALVHDAPRVAATLLTLKNSGIKIILDDFGTGSSSLSSLRNLPIGLVKVDRSFVADITRDPESASVARSIINLAHGLHIPVLAEGVETEGQLGTLLGYGCDQIQGYFFSRPVDALQMTAMLRSGHRLSAHLKAATPPQRTLLLVDDEPSILSSLKRLFRREGYKLLTASSGTEALELLACNPVDVIVSDQRMPGMTGVDFLRRTKALHPHTIRMTLSGFTDLQSIIDAVNEGAVYKFLTKPWDDERLREHVAQAFAQKEMADENRRLQAQLATANSEQAALNQRLARLLERQKLQSQLMQLSVASLRDMIDALPVAVVGVAADGMLAFLNQPATQLMPEAAAALGDHPGPRITGLIHALRDEVPAQSGEGLPVTIHGQALRAWLSPMPQAHVTADAEAWDDRGDVLVLVPQKT